MRRFSLLVGIVLASSAAAPAAAPRAALLAVKPYGAGARATATLEIRASRATVWRVLTSCAEAVKIVPGLRDCEVQATAADGSWQRIRQVVDYSWYLPKISYVVRATYRRPDRIDFERTAGDLAMLRGYWELRRDGNATVAHCVLDLVPGFWMPAWIARLALERELPQMLAALRREAQAR